MACTSAFTPAFLAQNPAISGYVYGWSSCAAFAGAEAASYSSCGAIHPSGEQVRNATNEPIPNPLSPGLTITQVTDALAKLGVTVTPFNRMGWSEITAMRGAGHGFSLCVRYSVIRPTRFTGDPNFYGNHQLWYPPSGATMDPLADGRRAGIYRYHGEVYPDDLMERAAGAFLVNYSSGPGPIGFGYAQGFYTTSHPAPVAVIEPPQESAVRVTDTVHQQWTAVGTNGVLRTTPARSAPIAYRMPAGSVVTSIAEAEDPAGNHWRLLTHPDGTRNPAWLLHYGPGIPRGHDWAAGPITSVP